MNEKDRARMRDRTSTRKEGLVNIQVREETRTLIKQLAARDNDTIPDFLAVAIEDMATALGVGVPESYATESKMDSRLSKGDFKALEQKKAKKTEPFDVTEESVKEAYESGNADAYEAWYKEKYGRDFPGLFALQFV